jgi:hypothetical protein
MADIKNRSVISPNKPTNTWSLSKRNENVVLALLILAGMEAKSEMCIVVKEK